MKKNFLTWILAAITLLAVGCSRDRQAFHAMMQNDVYPYLVIQFSGGREIGRWKFTGIVNHGNAGSTHFFFIGDTLVTLSGDVQVFQLPAVTQ